MAKDLFLISEDTKSVAKRKWLQGVPFESTAATTKFVSINNIDKFRNNFRRVIIQFKTGTMEV